ncbi:30S ribosomal protein S7 [bacterium]|nr:30S ribosomal protein S7 [bacterium]|tara:strand:- start:5535 stop:6008 length:474 start_codon:yes stop_codon:yes gene_type:complete
MRKRGAYKKIDSKPDFKYGRIDMGRFINYIMLDGEKAVAEKIFYGALEEVKKKTKSDPAKTFEDAMANATPMVEVVSRRVGGANYQIPMEVRPERKFFLAAHWIINAAKSKKGKPMHKELAEQIIAASKNEGEAIKKKQDTHRVAEANRAFASFVRR